VVQITTFPKPVTDRLAATIKAAATNLKLHTQQITTLKTKTAAQGTAITSQGTMIASQGSAIAEQGTAISSTGTKVASQGTTIATMQTQIPPNHVFLATLKREPAVKAGASGISHQGQTSGAYSASVMNAAINRINDLIDWDGAAAGCINTLIDALVNAGIIEA
jgi:hypothetical protein